MTDTPATTGHQHGTDGCGHDHGHDHSHAAADLPPVVPGAPETPVPDDRSARGAAALDGGSPEGLAAKAALDVKLADIEEALRDVVDPELGVNVVDLGLVYGLDLDEATNKLTIDMTLTSAACPLTDMIEDQIGGALSGDSGLVEDFTINWVWLPPWGPEKITDDGREQLRALGFNI